MVSVTIFAAGTADKNLLKQIKAFPMPFFVFMAFTKNSGTF